MKYISLSDYYIVFDLIEDNCAGRLRSTMGFWVRPDFNDLLSKLSDDIANAADPEDLTNRAGARFPDYLSLYGFHNFG